MASTPPLPAQDDRGTFIVIGGSPYVAYATHSGPAYLTRATYDPDGTITLHAVGAPHARLDLAADAGRWRAERDAYAATAGHACARCGTPLAQIDGAWVSIDDTTTAGGLSFCPPDPDTSRPRQHRPRRRTPG
ncbi:hypothetical protein [Dactylosporangium darangshiense]|uniref:Uncharacterized protein n=1 Tax=Dactylosporangium darangshiense TaxID=579108 RepID=A0ABP8DS84_9ACTN